MKPRDPGESIIKKLRRFDKFMSRAFRNEWIEDSQTCRITIQSRKKYSGGKRMKMLSASSLKCLLTQKCSWHIKFQKVQSVRRARINKQYSMRKLLLILAKMHKKMKLTWRQVIQRGNRSKVSERNSLIDHKRCQLTTSLHSIWILSSKMDQHLQCPILERHIPWVVQVWGIRFQENTLLVINCLLSVIVKTLLPRFRIVIKVCRTLTIQKIMGDRSRSCILV